MPKLLDRLSAVAKRFAFRNEYEAVESSAQRPGPRSSLSTEDEQQKGKKRDFGISETREARQNIPLARWAISKHIDFVAAHSFNASTGNPELDKRLERLVEDNSTADKFDALGRHPRRRYCRLMEAGRLNDGDIWSVKMKGGKLQAIEGDRVRNPEDVKRGRNKQNWVNGVRLDSKGRFASIAVHKRNQKRFDFERTISASRVIQHGFFDRFDQVRGISPILTSLNSMRDLHKGFDYTLGKIMTSQLLTFQVTRDSNDQFGNPNDTLSEYEVEFGKGPTLIDMDRGDEIKPIESKTPAKETNDFWQSMVRMSLLSLNIPYSFFDGSSTNFFGSRAELIHYLRACEEPRKDMQDFLNSWLEWRIQDWIASGELELPEGMAVEDLRWEWIPDGVAWWNPVQEVSAALMAVAGSLRSRREIRREAYGDDWFKVVDEIDEENKYLIDKGIPIEIPSNTLGEENADNEQNETEDNETQ